MHNVLVYLPKFTVHFFGKNSCYSRFARTHKTYKSNVFHLNSTLTPIDVSVFQNVGKDFLTTSEDSIDIPGVLVPATANAIAIRWSPYVLINAFFGSPPLIRMVELSIQLSMFIL